MSYQTFHPTTGSVQTFDENITDDESSPLYPFGKPVFLSSLSVQMAFVRKVWVIFTSELVAVTFTTALLIYMYDWRHFLQRHIWTWWASIGITFILLIALTYKSNDDFQPPWYLIMIYTCFNAYVVGFLVSILRLTFVLDTLILMLVASVSVLAFTYQTSYKFRAKEPIIVTSVMILIASFILHPWFFSFADLIPAFSLAWILSLYFILDTWYLMKQMSKDEYLGASMQLYLDLVIPFRIIHHMCELTAEFGEED